MSTGYTLHSEVDIAGLLALDCTTPRGDLVWVGSDGDHGKWVTADEAIQFAGAVTAIAQAQIARAHLKTIPEAAVVGASFDPESLEQGDAS